VDVLFSAHVVAQDQLPHSRLLQLHLILQLIRIYGHITGLVVADRHEALRVVDEESIVDLQVRVLLLPAQQLGEVGDVAALQEVAEVELAGDGLHLLAPHVLELEELGGADGQLRIQALELVKVGHDILVVDAEAVLARGHAVVLYDAQGGVLVNDVPPEVHLELVAPLPLRYRLVRRLDVGLQLNSQRSLVGQVLVHLSVHLEGYSREPGPLLSIELEGEGHEVRD